MIDIITEILVYAVVLGALYLMVSLGFSLICGVLGIFNLGYSATILVAIYGTWMLKDTFGLSLLPAIVGVFILQVLFTIGIIYFPIVKRYMEQEELLLTALLLVAFIVQETVNHFYPETTGVDIPTTILSGTLRIASTNIPSQMLIVVAVAFIVTAFFVILLMKTRIGFKIRAVSQDRTAAKLMGIKVERVYVLALVLAVIPPTIGMLVIAPVWGIAPSMGTPLLQTAILVTVLGGLGNLRGTVLASFIVGVVASTVAFIGNPRLVGMTILLVVFFVLIFKPKGLAKSETLW